MFLKLLAFQRCLIAAGTKHCVFLDRYGYVWTSGRNVGLRGFIRKSGCVELQKLSQLDKAVIVSVAAGGNMTFAIALLEVYIIGV